MTLRNNRIPSVFHHVYFITYLFLKPPEAPSNNYGDDRDFKRIISNMFLAMVLAHASASKPG
jgi:hypothetical protein